MSNNNQMEDTQEHIPELPSEMLAKQGQNRVRRRHSRSRLKRWYSKFKRYVHFRTVLISSIVIVIVLSLTISALIVDAGSQLNTSWQNMNRILQTVQNRKGSELTITDFGRIDSAIADLLRRINVMRGRIQIIAPITALNNDWKVDVELLTIADSLLTATTDMLDGLEPTINFLVQGDEDSAIASQISSGERVVDLLRLGQGQFLKAAQSLAQAEQRINSVDLTSVSPNLLLTFEQIKAYHQQLSAMNSVLISSPDILTLLLGVDEEKTYLVLAPNNDELRPSGGYISTYGWITIRNGRVTDYSYSPTTATSPRPPDESFLATFEIPDWWLSFGNPIYAAWDSSWYADFPSTAELAMSYYNAGQNPHSPVDGVISIDISGFELILATLGEIYVTDYDRLVDADNFRDVVYDIRTYGDNEHKRFLVALYQTIFDKWRGVEQDNSSKLLGALLESLTQRHIMIYYADEEANNALTLLGWSGAQHIPTSDDYIHVSDTNLGNKSNNSVVRSMTYDVQILPDQSRQSHLRVRYDYFASTAELDPAVDADYHGPIDYRSLTQIFLPKSATITDSSNLDRDRNVDLDDYALLVTRVNVDYDSSERIELSYETPATPDRIGNYYRYRLYLQQQPGSRMQSVNLQITLPENAQVVSLSPEADASYELEQPILEYRIQLLSDQWIEVIYQLDE